MPGIVSVKSPPDAPPLRITVTEPSTPQNPPRTPNQKPPSPFPSRSKLSPARSAKKPPPDSPNLDDSSLDNLDLAPFLLKLARDTIASGEGPVKALDYAIRAAKSFERCAVEGEPSLDLAMCLHVLASVYCSLGKFDEAVSVSHFR